MIRLAFAWGPPLAWMAAIFFLSSVPDISDLPGGLSAPAGHFIGYAVLSLLLARALAGGRFTAVTWPAALAAVILSTLYGLSDEWHQSFVPGRRADPFDVIVDALGAGSGAAVAWAWSIISRFWHSRGEPDGLHEPSARA